MRCSEILDLGYGVIYHIQVTTPGPGFTVQITAAAVEHDTWAGENDEPKLEAGAIKHR